jgi:beta-N-acetylhexosaminidase
LYDNTCNNHKLSLSQSILTRMSLEEKLGQMMMIGFDGPALTEFDQDFITKYHIGNVILMGRNVPEPQQTKALTAQLQRIAASRRCPVGFLIAIDQEGGVVTRLTKGATVFPGNMALGATPSAKSEDYAKQAATAMAKEMLAEGINMNLAPVLDINNNPRNPGIGVRSYGESEELVTRLGIAAIQGYQEAGIVATAKHCPGKGDIAVDSHLDLPTVSHRLEHLERVEFSPFVAAIQAGVDSVMTSHVVYPAIEPMHGVPGTLSHQVLTGLIRERFGFQGIIITDDLYMGAIAKTCSSDEATVRAIEAGADIALLCHYRDRQITAVQALYKAVESGRISRETVDESVNRILRVKAKHGLINPSYCKSQELSPRSALRGFHPDTPGPVEYRDHQALALEIARNSVTLLRNSDNLIPIKPCSNMKLLVISPDIGSITQVEDKQLLSSPLAAATKRFAPHLRTHTVSQNPNRQEIEHAAELAKTCYAGTEGVIILGTYNAHLYQEQGALARALLATGAPCVIVAMRNPYDIREFPDAGTYIAAYGFRDCTMQAAAEVIFGLTQPVGRLPVTVPGLHKFGDGIVCKD